VQTDGIVNGKIVLAGVRGQKVGESVTGGRYGFQKYVVFNMAVNGVPR